MKPNEDAHQGPPQNASTFNENYSMTCELTDNGVELTVKGVEGGAGFKGIFAQVRDGTHQLVGLVTEGVFMVGVDGSILYQHRCDEKAVTHTSNAVKEQATFLFNLGGGTADNLNCFVTVVKSRSVYWVQHNQPVVELD